MENKTIHTCTIIINGLFIIIIVHLNLSCSPEKELIMKLIRHKVREVRISFHCVQGRKKTTN